MKNELDFFSILPDHLAIFVLKQLPDDVLAWLRKKVQRVRLLIPQVEVFHYGTKYRQQKLFLYVEYDVTKIVRKTHLIDLPTGTDNPRSKDYLALFRIDETKRFIELFNAFDTGSFEYRMDFLRKIKSVGGKQDMYTFITRYLKKISLKTNAYRKIDAWLNQFPVINSLDEYNETIKEQQLMRYAIIQMWYLYVNSENAQKWKRIYHERIAVIFQRCFPEFIDPRSEFSIYWVLKMGEEEQIENVLKLGYLLNLDNMVTMIENNRTKLFEIMLEYDCTEDLDKMVPNLISSAAAANSSYFTQRLIQHGVNVNAKNSHNVYPIHHAINNLNIENMRLLIEAGASLDVKTRRKQNLLIYCMERKFYNGLKLLLEKGVDVNEHLPFRPAIHHAWKPEVVDLLVQFGAHLNVQYKGGSEMVIFNHLKKRPGVARAMILSGRCDLNVLNEDGNTPLMKILRNNSHDKVLLKYMLAHTDVFIKNKNGMTAFDLSYEFCCGCITRLIEKSIEKCHTRKRLRTK